MVKGTGRRELGTIVRGPRARVLVRTMDAWEGIGDSTMLRTYLQRAMSCLTGDGDPGIPVDRVAELFAVLNVVMSPSQLARLTLSLGIEEKHFSPNIPAYIPTCAHRKRQTSGAAREMFTLDDLHLCVLESLRFPGQAIAEIRKRLAPFAEAGGGSMPLDAPSDAPSEGLWVPLSQLGGLWQRVQNEPMPAEIRALAVLAASENLREQSGLSEKEAANATDVSTVNSEQDAGLAAAHAAPSSATPLRLSEGQVQWLFLSRHNEILRPEHLAVCQPMSLPLTSYFVESSHNTYLTGDQFTSASDARMYERILLQGCRCIEVDCWDGSGGEPDILHGRTLTSRIPAERVFTAIARSAFVASPYPVVVSLEMHCSVPQQKRLAEICRATLGDMLVYPKAGVLSMSPASLKHKVLLIGRPGPQMFGTRAAIAIRIKGGVPPTPEEPAPLSQSERYRQIYQDRHRLVYTPLPGAMPSASVLLATKEESPFGVGFEDLSDCNSFTIRESKAHRHLLQDDHSLPLLWSSFNCKNLTRVYPDARRVKSSNYNPFPFWAAGAQLCALNYQTSDRELQCARGFFRANGGCGYVLKPSALLAGAARRRDAEALLAGASREMPATLRKIRLTPLCGFLLPKSGEAQPSLDAWAAASLPLHRPENFERGRGVASPVVSLEVVGGDFAAACTDARSCANGESWQSEAVSKNGFNPVWSGQHGCEIVVSDRQLAVVRIAVYDGSRRQEHRLLGYAALPCHTLRPGVRTVLLQDSHGARLPFSRLLVLLEEGGTVPMPQPPKGGKALPVAGER